MKKERFFIVDAHALCYRSYYAFIKNPLFNSAGQNVSAIFGFARMLYKLVDEQTPDYLAVAFDPPVKSFRFKLYPDYKANRQKMPDDLRSQIDEIKEMVSVIGIPILIHNDYEADDILGTIAKKYSGHGREVWLVTGDKDAYQLLDDNIRIYANKKGISDYEIYDQNSTIDLIGIKPDKVIDFMALTGDASDNIPGVKGIGEKTALKLINEYGSLDSIYKNLDSITGKTGEYLVRDREAAFLSRDLAAIRTDAPIEIDLECARRLDFHSERVREYFEKIELRSLVRDFFGAANIEVKNSETEERSYKIAYTERDIEDIARLIMESGEVSIDTETTSVFPVDAELVGISVSVGENSGWYIPISSNSLSVTQIPDFVRTLAILKPVLEDESIKKIGQNIKYDIIVLAGRGIRLKGIYFDTMVASYCLNTNERRHNMDDLAMKHLNYKTISYKELAGSGKKAVSIQDLPIERLAEYAIEDADITLRLYNKFKAELESEPELADLFYGIEMPLVSVLAEMEMAGVKIDLEYFKSLSVENKKKLAEIEKRIYKNAGRVFNINSTKELSHVLFTEIGLKPVKKTKTGFSTDAGVLESLRGMHPVVDDLLAYRSISKLQNTYIEALPRLLSPRTGRIHTSYNQTVVATGRLSSSDPNLQNIPAREEMGRSIRNGFIPEQGSLLLSADYSQIELRLAAHFSRDENMLRAFREGIDIHNMTASSVFGVLNDEVDPDMRRQAKIINFATIYGVSPFGLSQQADIGVKEAANFIKRYFETYPGFRDYIDRTVEYAREHGYVKTLCGRRRAIDDIASDISFRREGAERMAINTPIQGTAADLIKIAMISISRELAEKKMSSRMIMQVHDELVFEVSERELDLMRDIVRRHMEGAMELSVPLTVDIGTGRNWVEAH
jgi:DNA polymerase-1